MRNRYIFSEQLSSAVETNCFGKRPSNRQTYTQTVALQINTRELRGSLRYMRVKVFNLENFPSCYYKGIIGKYSGYVPIFRYYEKSYFKASGWTMLYILLSGSEGRHIITLSTRTNLGRRQTVHAKRDCTIYIHPYCITRWQSFLFIYRILKADPDSKPAFCKLLDGNISVVETAKYF